MARVNLLNTKLYCRTVSMYLDSEHFVLALFCNTLDVKYNNENLVQVRTLSFNLRISKSTSGEPCPNLAIYNLSLGVKNHAHLKLNSIYQQFSRYDCLTLMLFF